MFEDMTEGELTRRLLEVCVAVVDDPRWETEGDDLGVSILGMLLYGFGLILGRAMFFLGPEEIERAVARALVEGVGAAKLWTGGLVKDAARSAIEPGYHPGQSELISVGHQYFGCELQDVVDNIFQNIASYRGIRRT